MVFLASFFWRVGTLRNVPDATAVRSRRAVSLRPFSFFLVVPVLFWLKNEKKMDHFSVGTQSFRFFVAASDSGCHWPARVTGFFTEFSSSSIRGRRVFIGFSQLALSLAEFYWVLPSFTGFHLVFLGFTGFLSSLTGFYLVLLGFI